MESSLDCIACFVRQALDAARVTSADSAVHEGIMREVLQWAAQMDLKTPPPVFAQRIHRRLRTLTGSHDPYQAVKKESNRMALALLPGLQQTVETAPEPLVMALRLALAGNVIDMGISRSISSADLQEAVGKAMTGPLLGPLASFQQALRSAHTILYLADNAGEIAFDRLLIQQLGPQRVTVAVRGAPVINDATREDATQVGLDNLVPIVENGSDAPGTLLDDCSETFRRRFDSADLIIAKGQGNFESLSHVPKNIFFLFKVKCSVVAAHVGLPPGTHVVAVPGA